MQDEGIQVCPRCGGKLTSKTRSVPQMVTCENLHTVKSSLTVSRELFDMIDTTGVEVSYAIDTSETVAVELNYDELRFLQTILYSRIAGVGYWRELSDALETKFGKAMWSDERFKKFRTTPQRTLTYRIEGKNLYVSE